MAIKLSRLEVGPWPMNTYLLICEATGSTAIVDPGADAEKILAFIHKIEKTLPTEHRGNLTKILITHGHPDHVGALDAIKQETGAKVYIHPEDAELFNIQHDHLYENNGLIQLGDETLRIIHTPGHTPGSICIDLCDRRVIVGDTIFVGGPGKTWSPLEFETTMKTMKSIVFLWPDDTIFFPGHGPNGRIGDERPKFQSFLARGWKEGLFGDVIWE